MQRPVASGPLPVHAKPPARRHCEPGRIPSPAPRRPREPRPKRRNAAPLRAPLPALGPSRRSPTPACRSAQASPPPSIAPAPMDGGRAAKHTGRWTLPRDDVSLVFDNRRWRSRPTVDCAPIRTGLSSCSRSNASINRSCPAAACRRARPATERSRSKQGDRGIRQFPDSARSSGRQANRTARQRGSPATGANPPTAPGTVATCRARESRSTGPRARAPRAAGSRRGLAAWRRPEAIGPCRGDFHSPSAVPPRAIGGPARTAVDRTRPETC